MALNEEQKSQLDQVMATLDTWDFSLTIQKLQEPGYAGWSLDRALKAERDYKRYIALTKVFNGYQPVPNGDIDRFWHEHILDTRRYAEDMNSFFGYFLHHYPFFGMRGEDDNSNWLAAVETSNDMWSSAFGEPLYGNATREESAARDESSQALNFMIDSESGGGGMPVQITITITVGDNGTVSVGTKNSLAAEAMKCPQACPNPGVSLAAEAMKCPQACPNPGVSLAAEAMKCPQACPNPGISANSEESSPKDKA